MYGPYTPGTGMRNQRSDASVYKLLKKPKHEKRNVWEPADFDDEEEDCSKPNAPPPAISSTLLPQLLHLTTRLRLPNPAENCAAAEELAILTNKTTADEDALVGKTGLIEAVSLVLCKGTADGRVHAAASLANLVASADSNKKLVARMPDALQALVGLAKAQGEREKAAAARAILNLVSHREAALSIANTNGALDAIASIVLTGRMSTKEEACKTLDVMISHGRMLSVVIGNAESVLQALKSASRSMNCSGRARLLGLSALHGLSRCSKVRKHLGAISVVQDVCMPILSSETEGEFQEEMRLLATMTAANLSATPDDPTFLSHQELVASLVPALAATIGGEHENGRFNRRSRHVLAALCALTRNDALKECFINAKLIELSLDLIALAHKQRQRGVCLEHLLELHLNMSFSQAAREKMLSLDCVGMLRAHARGSDQVLRKYAKAALWNLKVRDRMPSIEESNKNQFIYFSFHREDEARVARIASALQEKNYKVRFGNVPFGRDGRFPARPPGDYAAEEIAYAMQCSSAVVVCVSAAYSRSCFSRIDADIAEAGTVAVIPLLLDHAKPALHLRGVAPTLNCIDFADDQSFDLGMMELGEELSAVAQPSSHCFESHGFGNLVAPPTISFTDLQSSSVSFSDLQSSGWSQQGANNAADTNYPSSSITSTSWDGYESSFLRGGYEEWGADSVHGDGGLWEGPEDLQEENGHHMEEPLSFQSVEAAVSIMVKLRTSALEARVVELEEKLQSRKVLLKQLLLENANGVGNGHHADEGGQDGAAWTVLSNISRGSELDTLRKNL